MIIHPETIALDDIRATHDDCKEANIPPNIYYDGKYCILVEDEGRKQTAITPTKEVLAAWEFLSENKEKIKEDYRKKYPKEDLTN